MPVEKQVAIIYCGTMGLLKDVPIEQSQRASKVNILNCSNLNTEIFLIRFVREYLSSDVTKVLEKVASELVVKYSPQ